jgi:fructose-bisphosphate aldolase class II
LRKGFDLSEEKTSTMSQYRDIGLVNTKGMFEHAIQKGYAIPAYNFVNMEQLQAIVQACIKTRSPVIIQVSKNVRNYATPELVPHMVRGAMDMVRSSGVSIPVALNLDHGDGVELCVSCIEDGFSSVMIDGSSLPLDANIALTREVADYAHKHGVTVEGELGVLPGVEDDVSHEASLYTDPEMAEDFVKRSGADSLAVSIGNAHGVAKFKQKPGEPPAPLRLDILERIQLRLPGFPIVLHGTSGLPARYVDMINRYGGHIEEAAGIPETQVREAVKGAVCKVNIASDGWLVLTAVIRRMLHENPANFDPRKYMGPARDELVEEYMRKNRDVFGSAQRV